MAKFYTLLKALVFFLLLVPSFSNQLTEDEKKLMDEFIEALMTCTHLGPAVSIALLRNDEVVYKKAFGKADVSKDEDVTPEHRFCVASVTKSFTSTLLASLLTENTQYQFDTPVQDILGSDFRFHDEQRTTYATIEDLLAHRMGSQRFDGPMFLGEFLNTSSTELSYRLQYLDEVFSPRTDFHYNNYYYMLAGHVAEVISNSDKSYEELVDERLLDPLKMDSGVWLTPELDDWTMIAKPHTYTDDGHFVNIDEIAVMAHPAQAAGGLCVTMSDMSTWMRFHMGNGSNPEGGSQLVSPELQLNLHKDHQHLEMSTSTFVGEPFYPVTITTTGYALGFLTGTYRGYRVRTHSGGLFGYVTQMWMLPDMDIGIIVGSNGPLDLEVSVAVQLAAMYSIDILLGLQPWLDTEMECNFTMPFHNVPSDLPEIMKVLPVPNPDLPLSKYIRKAQPAYFPFSKNAAALPLESYVGNYVHHFGGNAEITYDSEKEMLHFKMGIGTAYLEPMGNHTFLGKFYGLLWFLGEGTSQSYSPLLYFQQDSNDPEKVSSVVIPLLSEDLYPVYVKDLPPPTAVPPTEEPTCPPIPTDGSTKVMVTSLNFLLMLLVVNLLLLS